MQPFFSGRRRAMLVAVTAITAATLCAPAAQAQAQAPAWPARPIKLIAPYPPGGGVDAVARLIGDKLAVQLGQPVVIDNKPGAGATIGADALAKSAPDGYTLMVGSITDYSIAPHVHKNLAFDLRRDFAPVIELGYGTVCWWSAATSRRRPSPS